MTTTLPTNKRFVKRLKRDLQKAGVTQWNIAHRAGVTDSYVWMVLAGRRTSPYVIEIAQALLAAKERTR